MIKPTYKELKPIPEKDMSESSRMALRAGRRAIRKVKAENKRLGLPLISWKDGKVLEIEL